MRSLLGQHHHAETGGGPGAQALAPAHPLLAAGAVVVVEDEREADLGAKAADDAAMLAEIRAMNRRMEIPTGFNFIQEKDIPQMITWALAESNPFYPVPIVYNRKRCEKVIRRIIREA